jgi:hypothetical protein
MKKYVLFSTILCTLLNICKGQLASIEYGANDYEADKIASLVKLKNEKESLVYWEATCFCKISYKDLTNKEEATGVCLDLTKKVNLKFNGLAPQSDGNVRECNRACTAKASNLSEEEKNIIAKCACAAGEDNGRAIRAFAAVGTKSYDTAQAIGQLVSKPAAYRDDCKCKNGWYFNSVTKKCAKDLCKVSQSIPNRDLGDWGTIWNNTIVE